MLCIPGLTIYNTNVGKCTCLGVTKHQFEKKTAKIAYLYMFDDVFLTVLLICWKLLVVSHHMEQNRLFSPKFSKPRHVQRPLISNIFAQPRPSPWPALAQSMANTGMTAC